MDMLRLERTQMAKRSGRIKPATCGGQSNQRKSPCAGVAPVAALLCAIALSGCVSRAKAKAQADAAFVAGQQQALAQMRQNAMQGAVVTINGPVRQPVLPWTERMTLGSALVAADYYGPDPTSIAIARGGRAIQVDPKTLLQGQDIQLLAGDIIQIQTGTTAP